jgi:oligopeptide transport system substrate-binding protein
MLKRSFFYKILTLAAALSLLLTMGACKGEERPENADKTILYHLSGEPSSLDPQIARSSAEQIVVEALFEGLVRLDQNNKPYPGAAKSWVVGDGGTRYTFHLREDAQWSKSLETKDGETAVSSAPTPLKAQDFVYAWRRAVDPRTGNQSVGDFSIIQNATEIFQGKMDPGELGVKAADDHTLVVTLEYASEDFLKLTATAPFMPCQEDFFNWTSGRYGLEGKYICGNGPFVLSNAYAWDHHESIRLKRSSSYRGENAPLPAGLSLSISEKEADVSDPVKAVSDGVVDLIELPGDRLEDGKQSGGTVVTFPMDSVWGLCFNTRDDLLKDKDVRRVFVQTLSREKLLEHLPVNAAEAGDIVPSSAFWNGKSYRSQAGEELYLKQDESVLSTLPSILSRLKLDTLPSITVSGPDGTQKMLNEMLITWNGRMGNYFNMETLSQKELLDRVKKGDYQAAVLPLTPSDEGPAAMLRLFSSTNPDNPAGWHSDQYDAYLKTASATGGEEGLKALRSAEAYLNQQGVFYPIYYTDRYYLTAKTLSGVVVHPNGGGIDFIQAGKEDS